MGSLNLTQLKAKQHAKVLELDGGYAFVQRLEALGVRPGIQITKISSHFWKGPVTVLVGKTKIAIGYGMAKKIKVMVK
ncbi:MAG: FeoA family protein [Candidatus Omnitrophota bacterium]|nr:ferrous iron transport protein A [Candidatus Omnitrophota bacterium]MBU1894596.1 ferrous iron transport protein A [Candidatus Omnitrophota bacterium]